MSYEIDFGKSLDIFVSEEAYLTFMNQKESGEGKASRAVFKYDYQRFVWAFVLGISAGKRKEIEGKKESSTKWSGFSRDMQTMMIALTLQELYKDNPDSLKADINNSKTEEEFYQTIRTAIEEYANAGFHILQHKTLDDPGYIEDFEAVVRDILSDDSEAYDVYFD